MIIIFVYFQTTESNNIHSCWLQGLGNLDTLRSREYRTLKYGCKANNEKESEGQVKNQARINRQCNFWAKTEVYVAADWQ